MGCAGGFEELAIDYAADHGMMTEANYPYKAMDGNCAYDKNKITPV